MNTWTLPELIAQLQQAFAGFLGMDPAEVNPHSSIKELGMDSLTAVELTVHPGGDRTLQVGAGRRGILAREPFQAERQPLATCGLGRHHIAAGPPDL